MNSEAPSIAVSENIAKPKVPEKKSNLWPVICSHYALKPQDSAGLLLLVLLFSPEDWCWLGK